MRARRGALAWLGALLAACAGDLVRLEGAYRHPQHGYRVEAPTWDGEGASVDASPISSGWERVDVEGAAIAWRRPGPLTMSLQSRCGKPVAEPAIMARHLVIGLSDRTLRQAGPVDVGGHDGWTQTFDTQQNGVTVRLKTVTFVERTCSYDFLLVGVGDFAAAERSFDAWWHTFRLDPPDEEGKQRP